MSFNDRLALGDIWAKEIKTILDNDKDLIIVPMGLENVLSNHYSILSSMKEPSSTIKFIRFFPDGYAINLKEEDAFFYDAKFGQTIEKDAFNTYCVFVGHDRRMVIFIKNYSKIYCVPLQKIKFQNSEEKTSQYKHLKLPVDNEGWIAPRLLPEEKYKDWKLKNPLASGTPYKYFDFRAMEKYEIFNEIDSNTLKEIFEFKISPGQQTLELTG
jgi:hypothetical protein